MMGFGYTSTSSSKAKLYKMWDSGEYVPPDQYDDLEKGISLAIAWSHPDDPLPRMRRYAELLMQWASDAKTLLGNVGAAAMPGKLPPMHCVRCNHYNEYVGQEHLVGGVYKCRSCK